MDNTVFKSRYQNNYFDKKKKSANKLKMNFKEKLGIQIVISLLILMFAGIVKNSDTKVTYKISENIKKALSVDMEIKELTAPISSVINQFLKDENTSKTTDDNLLNPTPKSDKSNDSASTDNEISDTNKASDNALNTSTDDTKIKDVKNIAQTQTPAPTAAILYKGIFITPSEGTLGATFGDTVDQLTQKTKSHKGVDIESSSGTDIKAAANGIVIESAFDKVIGNYIKIEHNSSYYTIYGQCSQLIAKKGQKVAQGDIIAKVGNTGSATGSHLHFEIWKDGKAVNPLEYIKVPGK